MTIYDIGTGIAEVTDPAIGLKLQGMADPFQETQGVESSLYARAFIVVDRESSKRVLILSADIWSGTQPVKAEVIKRLQESYGELYKDDNVLISGTHTHSGPGGYSGWKLYDDNCGGFDWHNFECIVSGMVTAINNAHGNLAPGRIYINKGEIVGDCGKQRSEGAFKNNKEYKENSEISQTDKEMLLLKFVALDQAGELPIGTINWYAIHPTDRGQANRLVSGDNKGWASKLFEEAMGTDYSAQDTFVAAFANSNCGDVSGNVGSGVPNLFTATTKDIENMQQHGTKQFETAKLLFDIAREELSGTVDYRHQHIDLANIADLGEGKRTYPAALGASFAAGSSEDSIPVPPSGLREGITANSETFLEKRAEDAVIAALAVKFGAATTSKDLTAGHSPKPIVFAPGLLNPPIVPNFLPIQILKIGNLVITGVPAELTTMAGRRLKQTVLDDLKGTEVNYLALATYANGYSQYVTTKEEYDMQHYEGASTLFGPYTLEAYQQEFKKLADSLKSGTPNSAGTDPQAKPSSMNRRITVRNLTDNPIDIEIYKQGDSFMLVKLPGGSLTVPSKGEIAYFIPSDVAEIKLELVGLKTVENVSPGLLLTIEANGQSSTSAYIPPQHIQPGQSTIGRQGPRVVAD